MTIGPSRLRGLLLAAVLGVATPGWPQEPPRRVDESAIPRVDKVDSMAARVQGCATCHGWQGQGTGDEYFPRIAGKPAGYLFNQLRAFHTGARRYAPMNYLLAYMTDDYLREMAEYFAAQRPAFGAPAATAVPRELLERGRTLVQVGDPTRQLPACAACHGASLTGMEPGIPGLVGLRPNYINAQLTRWRSGERVAAAPDCMHRIASRLDDPDIVAVSAWLGSRPAPSSHDPERRNIGRMPMACGSQP
ncbi:c-type cytochrome [Ramlibacter tataouinensis]|uniref:c-type cytochrome n=1 Tax=Ramlibacter tataouinensis TaxID=94132 RepID=UPI0022F3DD34|nr:c-type cytochrome [Ramlibacter tataouinensis]WBY02444.1 c-type cytochrome [Ramlibacter tataouinensis]